MIALNITENMSLLEKLTILSDAAKYDVACTSSGVDRKGNGHGIGLARIKELVNLYQGEIRVESEPKSGTSFFLTFFTQGRRN